MNIPRYLLLFTLCSMCNYLLAQSKAPWMNRPQNQWPSVALINEVWYKNGEQYVHPSFQYAATGFLIDTGKDTLAVTAKHVLWIAKMKNMHTVALKDNLQKWLMHPKNNLADSVVIASLLNTDTTEILEGKHSSITQRDWLVFSTKYVSPNLQPLKPRYSPVIKGETTYIFACPYKEKGCVIYEGRVIETTGNRILISTDTTQQVGGASGSPIVDKNGQLIGILGGSSTNRLTGQPAFYGLSTRYLQKVLKKAPNLNQPLLPIDEHLRPLLAKESIEATVNHFYRLYRNDQAHFSYDFSSEQLNKLGNELVNSQQLNEAVRIYQLSLEVFPWSFTTYNLLGMAYEKSGKKAQARQAFEQSLQLNPTNKTAQEALQKL
ncbi:MAG TPA: hypothetical protein DCR35_04490 [Runella sp.]|nr:hypothetical protein [Runella sp.]HAO48608.1 hypothetical protein [Runella sp.]